MRSKSWSARTFEWKCQQKYILSDEVWCGEGSFRSDPISCRQHHASFYHISYCNKQRFGVFAWNLVSRGLSDKSGNIRVAGIEPATNWFPPLLRSRNFHYSQSLYQLSYTRSVPRNLDNKTKYATHASTFIVTHLTLQRVSHKICRAFTRPYSCVKYLALVLRTHFDLKNLQRALNTTCSTKRC